MNGLIDLLLSSSSPGHASFKYSLYKNKQYIRYCHLLTYLRVNILIGVLVVGAITAIFWATTYSQDNKEVQETDMCSFNPSQNPRTVGGGGRYHFKESEV